MEGIRKGRLPCALITQSINDLGRLLLHSSALTKSKTAPLKEAARTDSTRPGGALCFSIFSVTCV